MTKKRRGLLLPESRHGGDTGDINRLASDAANDAANDNTPPDGRVRGDQLLTIKEILATLKVSRSTYYRIKKDPSFPPPVPHGTNMIKHWASDVDRWLAGLAHDRDRDHGAR